MTSSLIQTMVQWVTSYGYPGIFLLLMLGIVGLPVPDEMLLTFAGYLVFRGDLRAVPTLASAFLGSVCGISLSYVLGRASGILLLDKYGARLGLTQERLERAHHWFSHFGRWALVIGYFVPGVRHGTAYAAGASRLEYSRFAFFAYLGGLIWTSCFLSLGYFLGEEWRQVAADLHRIYAFLWPIVAGAVVAYLLWRAKLSRSKFSS